MSENVRAFEVIAKKIEDMAQCLHDQRAEIIVLNQQIDILKNRIENIETKTF